MEYQNREPQLSEREIERRYAELGVNTAAENRVNCYTCSACGYVTKTIDRHVGVTPMFIACHSCRGRATSSWYNDTRPDQEPEYEWFMPTLEEVKKYKRNPAMLDHIFSGGLDMRRIVKEV